MPTIRLLRAYPSRWGPGKTHAATYVDDRVWGKRWLPICAGKHIHAEPAEKVGKRELANRVTCQKCLEKLPTWRWKEEGKKDAVTRRRPDDGRADVPSRSGPTNGQGANGANGASGSRPPAESRPSGDSDA